MSSRQLGNRSQFDDEALEEEAQMQLQPLLHELLVATMAPTQAWSAPDGQVRASGAQGCYHGDVRVLSRAVLTADGVEPESIAAGSVSPGVVEVVALLRGVDSGGVDSGGADPLVTLRRVREVRPGVVSERIELTCATSGPVPVLIEVELACDLADIDQVKQGGRGAALPARPVRAAGPEGPAGLAAIEWEDDGGTTVRVSGADALLDLDDPRAPRLSWRAKVLPGATTVFTWEVVAVVPASVVGPPSTARPEWSMPEVTGDDRRLARLLDRALDDLAGLRMSASFAPDDTFLAAGAPWFFTLFGRDSLWAARMLLPLGTSLAAGTLRVLAARQGTVVDEATAEQPGKILHEIRSKGLDLGDGERVLPPIYYGTVDATPLWICLLHDAWRWGLAADEVEALLPAMERALAWMTHHGDADGDGFLEYADTGGHGLANQGWKDSGDSVQWRDGSLAAGPIALCEVQGYAHEAALAGAALLEAFGRPGAHGWRLWAAGLAERFRAKFWVEDSRGRYPAIALDADKNPVDTLTSNIGHLLGSGLLSAEEERIVALRLAAPDMDSGYGLRTMSSSSGGYWPLRYHGGSVWAHDTAIAISGLARSGHTAVAAQLVEGLLAAGEATGYRLPELYSGHPRGEVPTVVPYPAACRPQAWSAAAAVSVLSAALGLQPDAPGGVLRLDPPSPSPVGAVRASGLRLAGRPLTVQIDACGAVLDVQVAAAGITVELAAHVRGRST